MAPGFGQLPHPEFSMESSRDNYDFPQAFFKCHPTVRFIRFQWIDLSGVLRTRMVPKAHCMRLMDNNQYLSLAVTLMLFPVSELQVAATPATGCAELRPDWASLRVCFYAPAHASVMCSFYVQGLEEPYGLCPKTELERTLSRAESSFGKTFAVGFEVEFVLLDNGENPLAGVDSVTTNSTSSGHRGKVLEALEDTVGNLEAAGIVVQSFHAEGPSQLEVATGPLPPLEAIAALMYTHETIKTVFLRHNIMATMAPDASPSAAKSGAHMHISLHEPDGEDSFLAGMLDRLRTISAFGLANYDSFSRVRDFANATGTCVSWGLQHRDVPIRKVENGHWELRCVDATANPYLVLSLLISAGLEGLATSAPLTMPGLTDYASNLDQFGVVEMGIRHSLPRSMEEAVGILIEASRIDLPISKALLNTYLAIKEVDLKAMESMSDEERRVLFVRTF